MTDRIDEPLAIAASCPSDRSVDFRQARRVVPITSVERQGISGRTGVRNMRVPRSAQLIAAIHRLDAGVDEATRAAILEWIEGEYRNEIGDLPLGFVAVCGLGPPYVDHILDLGQRIVEHYASADPMPEPYNAARMLARNPGYAFVEVYFSGIAVPVLADGSVVL